MIKEYDDSLNVYLIGKHIKGLLQGPRYGASLDDKIDKVGKLSKYFRDRVSLLARKVTADVELTAQRTEQHVGRLIITASKTDSTIRRTGVQIERLNDTTNDIMLNLRTSQMSLEGRLAGLNDTQHRFQVILQEQFRNAECQSTEMPISSLEMSNVK